MSTLYNLGQIIFNYHPRLSEEEKILVAQRIDDYLKRPGYKISWNTSRFMKSEEDLSRCHCNTDDNIYLKINAVVFPYYSDEFSQSSKIYKVFLCTKCQSMRFIEISIDIDD